MVIQQCQARGDQASIRKPFPFYDNISTNHSISLSERYLQIFSTVIMFASVLVTSIICVCFARSYAAV